jgi:hypothetical protein
MKNAVSWDDTVWVLLELTFRRKHRLDHLGVFPRNTLQFLIANVVPNLLIIPPWLWSRYIPPKRRFLQEPNGITSQETAFFEIMINNCGAQEKTAVEFVADNFP